MSELRSNEARRVSDRMITAWRLCIEHKHEPQPGLGQFDWPRVLTRALDEVDRLQAEVSQLRAKIETALAEAERFMPYEKGKIRAALAEPLGSTPEQPAEGRSAEPMPTAATIAGIERIASQRTGPEFRVELEDEA